MGRFDGKVVLLGGNLGRFKKEEFQMGLGGIIAKNFVDEGAQVCLVDTDYKITSECAKVIGNKAKAYDCDLIKDRAYEKKMVETEKGPKEDIVWTDAPAADMVNKIVGEFGKIDVVVTNFDKFEQARIDNTTDELYNDLRDQNVIPVFHIMAAVRDQLANQCKTEGTYASIVMLSSMVGKAGMSLGTVYSAMKAAIVAVNKGLAREFGRFARVNTVTMGPLADSKKYQGPKDSIKKGNFMITSGEYSNINLGPEHIAPVVLFLASNDASGISGQSLSVDGGLWLKLEQ